MALPSWPSSDLWQRIAAGMLMDNTACPSCRCPAGAHRREMGVLFCPADADKPAAVQRYWDMLRRSPGIPNAVFLTNRPAENPTNDEMIRRLRAEADAAMTRLREKFPDFELYRPAMMRVISADPGVDLEEAYWRAKRMVEQRMQPKLDDAIEQKKRARIEELAAKSLEQLRKKRDLELERMAQLARFDPPPTEAERVLRGLNKAREQLPGNRPTETKPKIIRKRAYRFDEE